MKLLKKISLIALSLYLSGCAHWLDTLDLKDETVLPPSYPVDVKPPPKLHGSIYQSGHEVLLYQDHNANRIGDILTVRLEEATQGEKQSKMKTNKVTTNNTNNGSGTTSGGNIAPIILSEPLSRLITNTGSDLGFDGKGETNEYNKLHGTISVTVMRVLSNGNLIVQGESWITINQGREYVRLSGILRPEDIDPTNTVSSQRLANARINYSGSGQVGNASRGGLFTQMLYKFFPF